MVLQNPIISKFPIPTAKSELSKSFQFISQLNFLESWLWDGKLQQLGN